MRIMSTVVMLLFVSTAMAMPPKDDCCGPAVDRISVMTESDWSDYNDRIFEAMVNPIFTDAALRAVIQYGENLDPDRGDVIEVVRIYREEEVVPLRRMAVVALNELDDDWGIDFLARSYRFEDDPAVKLTIAGVLKDHVARHREGTVEVGELNVVWPVGRINH